MAFYLLSYLLNLLYLALLALWMPVILFNSLCKGKRREGLAAQLFGLVPRRVGSQPSVWLHAVSVGEVQLLSVLLEQMERDLPAYECVISTSTQTGYALAKKEYPDRSVFYCPRDFSWAIKTALRRIRPSLLVLAELELWPNFIHWTHRSGAKIMVVNGRLSENSFRGYQRIRPFVQSMLRNIDVIAAQNETYAERFRSLGALPSQVKITGSLKYDGAQTDRENPQTRALAAMINLSASDYVFLAGSTQAPEEEMALAAFLAQAKDYPQLRLILVPRHPERFEEVARLLDRSGQAWQRRSALKTKTEQDLTTQKTDTEREQKGRAAPRILLVDTIGELGAWWGTAHCAYVGGSMGKRGGQNMIEPAAYGAAVSFGPNTHNFRDIVSAMQQAEAARIVEDLEGLTEMLGRCLKEPQWAAEMGERAQNLVKSQLGATKHAITLIDQLLADASPATNN